MGVKSLENKEYEKLIAEAIHCIEKRNIDGLKLALASLMRAAHPNETMLIVFKAQLAALEVSAND
jgi:hypothetical protein